MTNKLPPQRTGLRILIADETLMVREQLKARLEVLSGITIVGEARYVWAVVKATRTLIPDVVIVSYRLLAGPSLKTLRRVREL